MSEFIKFKKLKSIFKLIFLFHLIALNLFANSQSSVTQESFLSNFMGVFNQNLDDLLSIYKEVLPVPDWESPYLSAYAIEDEGQLRVGFLGGLARLDGMTNEGIALITCHEIGHPMGGKPHFKNPLFKNLSSEGQADYYATSVCLKKFFSKNKDIYDELILPQNPSALKLCQDTYDQPLLRSVCLKTLKGILAFMSALAIMQPMQNQTPPSLDKNETELVTDTIYDGYPTHQCRLDTLVAGALEKPRPKCWFVK